MSSEHQFTDFYDIPLMTRKDIESAVNVHIDPVTKATQKLIQEIDRRRADAPYDPSVGDVPGGGYGIKGIAQQTRPDLLDRSNRPTPIDQDKQLTGLKDFLVKGTTRKQFASGMVRDVEAGKTDYTRVLDGPMLDRWAAHLTKAETRYPDIAPGVANWTLANGPEELERFRKSAFRHFRQWLRGDQDEDHAAAVLFNINGYEYVKARMAEQQKGETQAA